MRSIFSIAAILLTVHGFGQSPEETQILKLSGDIFQWEVQNKISLLENIFADRFVVVNSGGKSQTKEQYLTLLRSGNFVHDSITVEQNTATVADNTAAVVGTGRFVITSPGNKVMLHLSYIEVFTRPNPKENWKMLAMHASVLHD
jgi:hypothetical protein